MKVITTVAFLMLVSQICSTFGQIPNDEPGKRIVGGTAATATQFPWLAAIWKTTAEGRFFCGGSIFNEQWILTAAQCVQDGTSFTIQLGSTKLEGDDVNRVTITATEYVINERFDPTTSLAHDVGLIKLPSPLTFNDYIQAVEMIETMNPLYPGAPVTVTGWGQTSDTGDLSNDFLFVEVQIVDQYECQTYYGDQLIGSMVCTKGNSNEGTCIGDTGSFMMVPATLGNGSYQAGIASFVSQNGCESTDPKGFTRTDAYYGWIVNAIENN